MTELTTRIKKRNKSLAQIKAINENDSRAYLIHYSCESFVDIKDGKTPRITSIAIRNLSSAQTESFSIHQVAELLNIPLDSISAHYDQLEKKMLDDFYNYIQSKDSATWIHWNMRDTNYGFTAIEHRYRILNGSPFRISEDHKFDLSRALIDIYGINYISHPRLENIVNKNKMSNISFLTGAKEADAFQDSKFIEMHKSTLRKVDIFENIFRRIVDNTLKVNTSWLEQRGLTFFSSFNYLKHHWFITFIISLGTISGIGYKIFKIFHG